jgi:hypothetical protein
VGTQLQSFAKIFNFSVNISRFAAMLSNPALSRNNPALFNNTPGVFLITPRVFLITPKEKQDFAATLLPPIFPLNRAFDAIWWQGGSIN